jgi:hypothetical protein
VAAGLEVDEDDEEPLPGPDDELGTHVSLSGVQSVERSLNVQEDRFGRDSRRLRPSSTLFPSFNLSNTFG